ERAAAATALECGMSAMGPAKILAVDDEADFEVLIRQRFRHQIRAGELDFRFAYHGEEALTKLADEPDIELLLLDINMPVMDGLADRDGPLVPVRREMVEVLFADIVGFTRMAEHVAPEAVVTMLRRFHNRMTAEIFASGGTVEKYIGAAIFAVFGLPNAGPSDAANALRCAEGMLSALEGWNRDRAQSGEAAVAIGIGLNYGPAVVGDVGSERSLSFTVIGDTVNTASRLQSLTRSLETPLVAGGALVEAIAAAPTAEATELLERLQDQGEQVLRGRSGAVRIWTRPRPN